MRKLILTNDVLMLVLPDPVNDCFPVLVLHVAFSGSIRSVGGTPVGFSFFLVKEISFRSLSVQTASTGVSDYLLLRLV